MALSRIILARLVALLLLAFSAVPAQAQNDTYSSDEIVNAGHRFFGSISGGLATLVERAVSRYGLPNGYIIGQ